MLAGDVAVAAESATSSDSPATPSDSPAATITAATIVFLDAGVEDHEILESTIVDTAEIVLIDGSRDAITQITEHLAQRRDVQSIHIVSHGSEGTLNLAGQQVDSATLRGQAQQLNQWSKSLNAGADILLYGCESGKGDRGLELIHTLAALTGADVAASDDRTGNESFHADWTLEQTTGSIEASLVWDVARRSEFNHYLGIQIFAAGSTGDELMELEVNGQIVSTWFVAGTDAEAGRFYNYDYDVDGIAPSSIRVNFVNDLYDPARGIDRNLRVDYIRVDGVNYQAEDPAVFSTGTWLPGDGIQPGNRQSEYLNADGYFQFAGGEANNGNLKVFARGDTGQEQMQVLVDGNVVRTFSNVSQGGTTYSVNVGNVSPSSIRIAFSNDAYDPAQGLDRNLVVDAIELNGTRYETEAGNVFSTGTWRPGDGIVPGFRQSETLHSNGYFQYGSTAPPTGNVGNFVVGAEAFSVNEGAGTVNVTVSRIGGSSGAASVVYATQANTATTGSDYRDVSGTLFFADGETSKSVAITILEDGIVEGTENCSFRLVSSTGAGLLAPRTANVNINDNDSNLPSFNSFTSASTLKLNGNAIVANNNLRLTAATAQQRGSAYFTTPVSVDSNTSFETSFAARFDGGQGTNGGEGLAFVIQNSPAGTSAQNIGNFSGGLNYNALPKSIGIELDTFKNVYEAYADEITITKNGELVNPVRTIQSPYDLNNGRTHYVWVDYNGVSDQLSVYLSDVNEKPLLALMKTTIKLDEVVGNQAYVGFAAATGTAFNNTYIESWRFTLDTPDPNPPVQPQGIIVENDIITGLTSPLAIAWGPDGRNLYIAEKGGVLKVARDGGAVQTVIDISNRVNEFQDRGLLDFALHPNLQNNPYLYLLYTVDPPEVYNHVGNIYAGPDAQGNRAGQLIRVTLSAATNYTTVVAGSEVILLGSTSTWNNFNAFTDSTLNLAERPAGQNPDGSYLRDFINSDSRSHTVGSLAFGLDGNLFVSIGDGASFNQTDPRALRVQNVDSLSGKVLRINPITGQGLSDNPFFSGDANANRSKVYQYGLRNPWRLSVDSATGRLYIGETGLSSFEEINTGPAGANFGWPYFEGGQGTNRRTPGYENLGQSQAFYNSGQVARPGFIALPHGSGSDAIVLGAVARGTTLGAQYEGDIFYNDLARGVVRHADVAADGTLLATSVFTTGAEFVVDIQQGPDGGLYYVNLVSGVVGRWELV